MHFVRFEMARSSLISLLLTLQEPEIQAFELQLRHSPLHADTLAYRFLTWLIAHPAAWQAESGDPLPEQEVFQFLYPGQPFKPQRIRRVAMELKELLSDFIAQLAAPPIPAHLDRALRLLQFLLQRGAYPLFLKKVEELDHRLREDENLAPSTYLAKMWLEEMRSQYFIHQQSPQDSFQELNAALEQFYLSMKVEKLVAMRARSGFSPQAHVQLFPNELTSMLNSETTSGWQLVRIWKAVLALDASEGKDAAYVEIVQQLAEVKSRLPLLALRQIRGSMFNHLSRAEDIGTRAYYARLFELLKEMLAEGTLHLENHAMSMPFFLVTVRAGCLSGECAWVDTFIRENRHYLFGEGHEELCKYCELLTDFHIGRTAATWRALLRYRPRDPRLDAYARILQVQLAYDLDKDEELFRYVEALDKFILRSQGLGARFIALAKEFGRITERLGKAKFGGRALPKGLRYGIGSTESAEKLWLMEKIKEFQG